LFLDHKTPHTGETARQFRGDPHRAALAHVDRPLQVASDIPMILLLEVLAPPVLACDDPTTVTSATGARHFVRVVISRRPIMGQLLARLNVAQRDNNDLPLYANVGITRVIAEEHRAFSLSLSEGADEQALRHGDLRRTEGRFDLTQGGGVQDISPLKRHHLTLRDGLTREQATTMNLTLFHDGLRGAV
jgi:hypothetical protein